MTLHHAARLLHHAANSCVLIVPLCASIACVASNLADEAPALRETVLEGCTATVRAQDFPEVGAQIVCEIRINPTGDASQQFDPRSLSIPNRPETLGAFDVLALDPPRVETDANGTRYASFRVVLSTLDAGAQTPDPLSVVYTAGGIEREGGIEFPSFSVTSLIGDTSDPSQYRDIQGTIDIPAPISWTRLSIACAALVLIVALAIWAYRLGKKRAVRALEPDAWALNALTQLERQPYVARGEFARFYDELTAIARRYTALRFAIPAEQQTTRELLKSAASHDAFPPHERERMHRLLRLADLVKFASATPNSQSCAEDLAEIRAFITATRPTPVTRDGGSA